MVVILERRTTSTDYGPNHRADGKPLTAAGLTTLITRYLVLENYGRTVHSGHWRRGSRQSEN